MPNVLGDILIQKRREQIVYIYLSVDVPGDLSDINVSEQEVTQSRELEKKMTPQQLRQSEIIQKPNLEYVNVVEDEVNEPEAYEEASQNSAWHKAMDEEIIALEQNQTWELVPRQEDVKSISCK